MENTHSSASKAAVAAVLQHMTAVGNTILNLLAGLLASMLVLYSGYVLYDTLYTQNNATNSWELLQYRPDIVNGGLMPAENSNALIAINKDYRAWLTLYETDIDYPVMQGPDDLYYASHNVYDELSLTGAIYLAAGNTRGMTDSYNMIYGHHIDNGAMFGALDNYLSTDYLEAHKTGVLVTSSGVYDLTVFAVAETDAYEHQIYTVGNRRDDVLRFLKSPNEQTTVRYLDFSVADSSERIVALSTCSNAGTNKRLVVFAKMARHDLLTLDATGYGNIYDAQAHGLTSITTNYPEGTTFTFSIDGGKTWTTTPPTLTNVGTLIVQIRATNEVYGTSETTETIQVRPAKVTVTVLDAAKTAGAKDPEYKAVVAGLVDNQKIDYTIQRTGEDEEAGVYQDVLVAYGDERQGNYVVTYIPGTLTITASATAQPDPGTIIPEFVDRFQPKESRGRPVWALINLICLIITIYLFLPLLHLRAKFGRVRLMKKLNKHKTQLYDGVALDEDLEKERSRVMEEALRIQEEDIGKEVQMNEVTEEYFADAVEELYCRVKKYRRRFRIGSILECIVSIIALVVFILTEDMRLPMVLIDRWTLLMVLFLVVCWSLDVWLLRYRDDFERNLEKEEEHV